ncbi:3-deoxy-7-phosphoheptulonate synthase [Acinetobacter qingfengensis]|uniref:Phospho-2-dehydro-3-deoxyheptonate aldolase n=1 Tax=Acinetobacter qingfengensis TaxID=1262585 RepID=A0A1E7RE02_9GAMM|nr:3-deoxy-7-phosphoheptulonate synthase [Acinetobacter qingfengensis]KAA8734730.1 3-deoxy-7-phosphoheptulonate synthase [Acinetobacter qingfengensis]OEY97649.1 3-deoxy-7-phosphoheptulonate synthase [Acinetobacter qingfengensis]
MSQIKSTVTNTSVTQHLLVSPAQLKQILPLGRIQQQQIAKHRQDIKNILNGSDHRFLVIVGPCSIHDPIAVLEYAQKLQQFALAHKDTLKIVMRAYLEKPRSTVGWKGFVYDPLLEQQPEISDQNLMAQGLLQSRELLLQLSELNLALATEVLNPMLSHYFSDIYSWGAIGARTSESQIHREISSALPYSIGFKNGTDGNVNIALDAIASASQPHQFLGLSDQGMPAMLHSSGNDSLQIILRGSQTTTNYDAKSVAAVKQSCQKKAMNPAIIVDCSHGNSHKNPDLQPQVLATIADELEHTQVKGVMLESHLVHGKQSISQRPLAYGCSITDGCLGWEKTQVVLQQLSQKIAQTQQQKKLAEIA